LGVEHADVAVGDEELDPLALVGAPTPMWLSFEAWRRVIVPPASTLSWRIRKWVSERFVEAGQAFTRAP
jgi:hypothetical protein